MNFSEQTLAEKTIMHRHEDILIKEEEMIMLDEVRAAMAELEYAGIIEPTGEMRWGERSRAWRPVALRPKLDAPCPPRGIGFDEYQIRAS